MNRPEVQKGISYRKAEELLQSYRAMVARLEILDIELANLANAERSQVIGESPEDAISGMYFARVISDMPQGAQLSDKTGRVAVEWRERYEKDFAKVWRMFVLDKENKALERVTLALQLHKLNKAIQSLLPKEQDIVRMFYIEGMPWGKIGKKLGYEERTCKRVRDRAVWYMSLSLFARRAI